MEKIDKSKHCITHEVNAINVTVAAVAATATATATVLTIRKVNVFISIFAIALNSVIR